MRALFGCLDMGRPMTLGWGWESYGGARCLPTSQRLSHGRSRNSQSRCPNHYRYRTSERASISRDYHNTRSLAEAVYDHLRLQLPYGLITIAY